MEYQEFTAKSVNEAITQACLQFGVPSDRLEYQVVREATSGFLGIGSKPAVISARVKEEREAQPEEKKKKEQKAVPAAEKKDKVRKEEKTARKTSDVSKAGESGEQKKVSAAPAAEVPEKGRILTSDVIEQRAAAAAAKAKKEGKEGGHSERPERREQGDRRRRDDRRGHGRYDRRPAKNEAAPAAPVHEPSKPKPERQISPKSEEEVAALTAAAETFLTDVFKAMNVDVSMTSSYNQKEGALNIVFSGNEMGILIGKRGQTLDSLQYLTSLVVNKGKNEYIRVKLDTEDYRERREETLRNLARNIAYKVSRSHRPVSLEPMNPYERRIIHSALQGNRYVETYSEGEDPYRHVVVAPRSRR